MLPLGLKHFPYIGTFTPLSSPIGRSRYPHVPDEETGTNMVSDLPHVPESAAKPEFESVQHWPVGVQARG